MTSDIPVLIIGAGPAGQLSALSLARQGVASEIIDRRSAISTAPKAHAVNARTLEICQSLGIDAQAIRAAGASANDAGWVRFMGKLTGPEFGSLPYERQDDDALDSTPFPLTNIPQPKFEAILEQATTADPLISFSRNATCTSLSQTSDGVSVTIEDAKTGNTVQKSYAYVIAADGAGSPTRQALGIAMDGPEVIENFITIHFEADLRSLTDARPGVLYFLFDPDTQGVLIAYDRGKTWVLMHSYDPSTETAADYDEARCRDLVTKAIGSTDVQVDICTIGSWAMSAQVAESYSKGRVFLVGDAAHRFPPTGGLGLNTGAGDAQNLTWKLASVLKGQASPELLDTYEAERQPIARINSEQSLTNASKIFDLIILLLGLDPEKTAEHYEAVSADPSKVEGLPDAVEAQRPHFDSFNLQIGYRYASSALKGADPLPPAAEIETSQFHPSWNIGEHVPHHWVLRNGKRVSTHDMLTIDTFTLLTGPKANGAFQDTGLDISSCQQGTDFGDDGFDWQARTGLPETGAVLVRPDGHIAARFTGAEDNTPQLLKDALASALSTNAGENG